jgi:hypothetical protein
MRELEGSAVLLSGTLNAQGVANTLWAWCVFSILGASAEGFHWVHTVAHRLGTLERESTRTHKCFTARELRQLHQFFVWCTLEGQQCASSKPRVEALIDVRSLKDACRLAFEGTPTAPSVTQQQVSETLRRMGLWVEDEVRCPKSGYSIDMIAVAYGSTPVMGGESISMCERLPPGWIEHWSKTHNRPYHVNKATGKQSWDFESILTMPSVSPTATALASAGGGRGLWAVEFDGPGHFLASGAPTGATLLKRRHLILLGYALVSLPYWEWDRCKGEGDREQYLRSKLGV